MAKPAPRQERSRRRREALLRAAIELLAENGAKGVTHRAVAARAGLPPATTTYYFDSIEQLTREALALHVADRVAELRALADAAAASGGSPEDIGRNLITVLTERSRQALIGQFEVYLQAAREPALAEPVAEAIGAFEALAAELLELLGARRPAEAAEAFVALFDGFALHRASRPRSVTRDAEVMFDAMRSLFIAYVMEPEELARREAELTERLVLPARVRPA